MADLDWADRALGISVLLCLAMFGWWLARKDVATIDIPVKTVTTQEIKR